jgi:hypothetical protein
VDAQPYSTLHGAHGTFTSGGLMLFQEQTGEAGHYGFSRDDPFSMDLTLFLHRVSFFSEVPPTNVFYVSKSADRVDVPN